MVGARFAVIVRQVRVLPSPSQATRNLSFLRGVQRRRHVVVSSRCFTGLVRVGLNFPLNGNRANMHAHVAVMRGMFGARLAVLVRRARVLPSPS